MNSYYKKVSAICVALLLFQVILPTVNAEYPFNDYAGHWAEAEITRWIENGVLVGDGQGFIRPDDAITRAEYAALLNKLFGFSDLASKQFLDVQKGKWYYQDILIAKGAGYYLGDHNGRVKAEEYLTREDAFVILGRILSLAPSSSIQKDMFNDLEEASDYAKDFIVAFTNLGYINGYEDKTCKPKQVVKRSEIVQLLSNLIQSYYREEGTYEAETINGNVVISKADVTLNNTTINGNLYLAQGINDGEVYLNNVNVKGEIFVFGGGENSIYLQDVTSPKCTVKKKDGKVRLVATGKTSIDDIGIQSGVNIKEESIEKGHTGFLNASITGEIPVDDQISLLGDFDTIKINSTSKVKLENCRVKNIEIKRALEEEINNEMVTVLEIIKSSIGNLVSSANGCKIAISNASKINNLSISAKTSIELSKNSVINKLDVKDTATGTTVDGEGTIEELDVKSEDVVVNGNIIPKGTVKSFTPNTSNDSSNSSNNSNDSDTKDTVLIADTENNNLGNSVTLTLQNNSGFSNNISEITIDGRPVPIVSYVIEGNTIVIDASAFNEKDVDGHSYTLSTSESPATSIIEQEYMTYHVVVKSAGYTNQEVDQRLYTANAVQLPIQEMGVYYNYDATKLHNVKPVEVLEEIILNEYKQYYGVYKVLDGHDCILLNASEVENSQIIFSIANNSVIELSSNGYAKALAIGETTMDVTFNENTFKVPIKVGMNPPELIKDTTNTIIGENIDLTIEGENVTVWKNSITSVKTNDNEVGYEVVGDIMTVDAVAFTTPSSLKFVYASSNDQKVVDNQTYDTVFEHVYGNTKVSVEATDYISAQVWQDVYMPAESTTTAVVEAKIITTHSDYELVLGEEDTNQLYAKLILEDGKYVKPGYNTWYSNDYNVVDHKESDLPITWSSSDEAIATVDENGVVTAVSKGEVVITATYQNTVATTTIWVNDPSVVLVPDSTVTTTSSAITITFENSEWANSLENISLLDQHGSEHTMDKNDYTVNTNTITVDAQKLYEEYPTSGEVIVYVTTGSSIIKSGHDLYTFVMDATNYEDSTVIQPIDLGKEHIVTIANDLTDNTVGSSIQVSYEDTLDNYDFGDTIVSISINDTILPINQYTIEDGQITFNSDLFMTEGAYEIEVLAVDVNGIFGLDDYSLKVVQVVTPEVQDSGLIYILNNDTIYGLYSNVDTTTSSALYMEIVDEGDYAVATYNETSTTGSSVVVTYKLANTYEADHYRINNKEVISIGTMTGIEETEKLPVFYGVDENANVSVTTSNEVTILHEGDSIPENAIYLQEGDIINVYYDNQLVVSYRWQNNQWSIQ